ncbi:SIMPL domain-containing protein [Acinetobacter sp. MD2(2019)]|uniref:SIMPL domain-containing protein n=1 Tax=Acinetobacter sp. MD2(2019) TaxID=2605273 RepID=UPI002D1E58DE|nr:SIMPL domain-containing protein [Acinetobacter sp. MD2(2019)]MEB3753405.1 SIMPL domain-containing protein [Acinetobacter sp. MD2(2019)]
MHTLLKSGLFILAGTLSCASFAQDTTQSYNMINLQANASRQVLNDQMQVVLYIEKNNKQPAVLATETTQAMNQALASARAYPQIKVTTGTQTTQPIYDDKNKLKDWRSYAELRVEGTDFKAVSQLVSQLQNTFQTQSVQFNVSDDLRRKVENELMVDASKQFQQRAESLTKVWHKSSYQLVNLNINSNTNAYAQPYLRANVMKAAMDSEAAPVQDVSAGETKFNVTANGSIQLK